MKTRVPMVALFSEELNSWGVLSERPGRFHLEAATSLGQGPFTPIGLTSQIPDARRKVERRSNHYSIHATSSSLHFQAIFGAALNSYQKQTKKDLLAHPLATQFQSCDSIDAILAILRDQVQEFDKSRSGDVRLSKWLSPTVYVLSAFSATISGGVSLVSLGS